MMGDAAVMMRTKIISLFNHKGGVSKTTTTFHLGWMLAILGKRVMIVDTDPQCNLTGMCISNTHNVEIEELYQSGVSNIRSILSPVFDGKPEPLSAANCYTFREIPNLFLLPGHIAFSEYDATYNIAENLTGSLAVFQNVPGYKALKSTPSFPLRRTFHRLLGMEPDFHKPDD